MQKQLFLSASNITGPRILWPGSAVGGKPRVKTDGWNPGETLKAWSWSEGKEDVGSTRMCGPWMFILHPRIPTYPPWKMMVGRSMILIYNMGGGKIHENCCNFPTAVAIAPSNHLPNRKGFGVTGVRMVDQPSFTCSQPSWFPSLLGAPCYPLVHRSLTCKLEHQTPAAIIRKWKQQTKAQQLLPAFAYDQSWRKC